MATGSSSPSLADTLKKQALEAAKRGDDVAKSILRLALGELQTAEARENRSLTDEEAVAVLRKLVKSNDETLSVATDAAQRETLTRENAVLTALLPATLTAEQLAEALAPLRDGIRAAPNDGAATGIAMKHVKAQGLAATGQIVSAAVKLLRA